MAKIQDLEVSDQLASSVDVDPDDIVAQAGRIPSDVVYYSTRAAEALATYEEKKAERDRIYGELLNDASFIAETTEALGKAPNLDQLKGAILNHTKFMEAKAEEIEALRERWITRGYVDAIDKKSDMLLAIARVKRFESGSDPDDNDSPEETEGAPQHRR